MQADPALLGTLIVASLLLGALLAVLSSLLERSGPIRLQHWLQEAGAGLQALHRRPPRFEAYRYLLSLFARLALAGFFGSLAALLLAAGVSGALLAAFGVLALAVAGVELLNRHLVGRHPEASLRALTPLFRASSWLLAPLLPLLARVLPAPPPEEEEEEEEEASRAEIEAFIGIGRKEGILEESEEDLLRGVVGFGDTQVRSVMTPRIDMVCAPLTATPQEVAELVLRSGHSRIPIYRGSVDEVVGVLHLRDLLRLLLRNGHRSLADVLQPPHFVPETKTLAQLLRELQERHQEVAVVVDEYGGTQGMVTIEDLLEEIFGELGDTHDAAEPEEVQLPDGSWRVAGRMHVEELEELFAVQIEDGEWETVGGLIFGLLGHVPRVGDSVEWQGLRFVVEAADHRRARQVRVQRVEVGVQREAELG